MRPVTDDDKAAFLDHLRNNPIVTIAARKISRSLRTMYEVRERDKEFAAEWDYAIKEGHDILKAEAWRRAVEGTQKPVYQKGELVGHETVYHDRLMEILLLGAFPDLSPRKFAADQAREAALLPPTSDNDLARRVVHIMRTLSVEAQPVATLIPVEKK